MGPLAPILLTISRYSHLYLSLVDQDRIGYDAAVCVEAIEPWLVDTYNATTGHATSLKIVGPGGISSSPLEQGQRKGGEHPVRLNDTLSSVGKFPAFALAHFNSRNQILKVCFYIFKDTVI